MMFGKTRKGGILDIPLAIVLSLILAVCLVLFWFAQHEIHSMLLEKAPDIQRSFGDSVNVTTVIGDTVGDTTLAFNSFKWISVMLIFGFFTSILVSAFMVKTHPAWFVGYFFMVVISVILSVYVSNTYEQLMNDPTLASTFLSGFFGQNWIFLHLPIWVTVFGFLAGILMYINLNIGGDYYD